MGLAHLMRYLATILINRLLANETIESGFAQQAGVAAKGGTSWKDHQETL